MIKKTVLSILLLFFSVFTWAQNIDSLNLLNAKWKKQKLAPKTKLISYNFSEKNLFNANQNLTYVEVKNSGKWPAFAVGADAKVLKTTQTFAEELGALAALNGTFFDIKNGGSVDFVKVDGVVINPNRLEKGGKRARHQQAAIVIENGKLTIQKWDGSDSWEESLIQKDVMLSGPLLSFESRYELTDTTAFSKLRHPRTAIGIKPNGRVILLTADGRQEQAAGLSLPELAQVMRWLGCTTAINLDGGGSTTLWVSGSSVKGVVNYPSDNKKWDHEGARKVANVILLKGKKKK